MATNGEATHDSKQRTGARPAKVSPSQKANNANSERDVQKGSERYRHETRPDSPSCGWRRCYYEMEVRPR